VQHCWPAAPQGWPLGPVPPIVVEEPPHATIATTTTIAKAIR
jgi:hypothetical protein